MEREQGLEASRGFLRAWLPQCALGSWLLGQSGDLSSWGADTHLDPASSLVLSPHDSFTRYCVPRAIGCLRDRGGPGDTDPEASALGGWCPPPWGLEEAPDLAEGNPGGLPVGVTSELSAEDAGALAGEEVRKPSGCRDRGVGGQVPWKLEEVSRSWRGV